MTDATPGQAIYTPLSLRFYDAFVLGFSNAFLWECPTRHLEALYQRNVSANHADIGVGTGYFLDRVMWPAGAGQQRPAITLVDLNRHSLEAASQRIRRYEPRTIEANVLEPWRAPSAPFSSVGLCYLLHCLPGTMREKAVVFDHLIPNLAPSARVFGATIVQGSAPRSSAAQMLMDAYNRRGIFSNTEDTSEALEGELNARFSNVKLERIGCVVLFEASLGTCTECASIR